MFARCLPASLLFAACTVADIDHRRDGGLSADRRAALDLSVGAFSVVATGDRNALRAVWGRHSDDLWVGGDSGTLLHLQGGRFTQESLPSSAAVRAIWGSTSSLWAIASGLIGRDAQGVWRYDASGAAIGDKVELAGLGGTAPDDVWAVGSEIWRYRGTTWQRLRGVSDVRLNAIWAADTGRAFAVGSSGSIVHSVDGALLAVTSPTSDTLWAVWGANARTVWAVGDNGRIVRFDGSAWQVEPSPTQNRLLGVWGRSPAEVWAVGGQGTILRFDGIAWRRQEAAQAGTTDLYAVWGNEQDLWVVGDRGIVLARRR